MSQQLALHLLGSPKLQLDDHPVTVDRRKTLALLAYLAVNRGGHTREYLSSLLWPEYDQTKAFTNLRHTLWETQQTIGEGWILANHETIELNADSYSSTGRALWLDVARFESLIAEGHKQNDVSIRITLLTDSINHYRNHFLTGFSLKDASGFNEWANAESENLRHKLAGALTWLSGDHCALGQAQTAIPYAKRLVALDTLNEASHRKLMQIYIQAGQHNSALKQYQTCENILRKELGLDPHEETRALYKQIRKGQFKSAQPINYKEPNTIQLHNLPIQFSTFIGREQELYEIAVLIADHRLVTLVGTGGIGKTRLSLKVGEGLLNDFANGIWLVELASLSDSARVPQAVAAIFNLVEGSEEPPAEKLIRVLRTKTTLLILDNCEHLLDACSHLADILLKNCANLRILATSREPLGITGEALYHVPSLGLPDIQQLLEKILGYESVRLFEERARLIQEHFALTMKNASSIVQICQRLDGIPLAIELAASRINLLSTEQIALRLDESFNLLTGGSRTTLPRHQTLRASIDWSWNLLSETERILLQRLAVFAGGWTLEGAESLGVNELNTLDLLNNLVEKSLVLFDSQKERYRMLEMIRQYANEKLVEAGEEENIHNRHLNYFLGLSERIEHELIGPQQMEWYGRTIDERDNLRTVLKHASKTDVETGLYISSRLKNFWEYFDNNEGAHWLSEFIQKPDSRKYPLARAKALCAHGWFLAMLQQFDAAHSAIEESLELYRAGGDQHGEVDGLVLLGFITDGDKKTEYGQEALALARAIGDMAREATALNFLGWDHSDLNRALAYWEESIPLYREMGNRRSLANCLGRLGFYLVLEGKLESAQKYLDESSMLYQQLNINMGYDHLNAAYGELALQAGDYAKARTITLESARIAKDVGSRKDYLWANFRLGVVELREGNLTEARRIFVETTRAFQKDGSAIGVVVTVQYMAGLFVAADKAEGAARLIGWADTMRAVINNKRPLLEQADVDRDVAASIARIGKTAFDEAYNNGRSLSLDGAVGYALEET